VSHGREAEQMSVWFYASGSQSGEAVQSASGRLHGLEKEHSFHP